jgi:hypothetical protein
MVHSFSVFERQRSCKWKLNEKKRPRKTWHNIIICDKCLLFSVYICFIQPCKFCHQHCLYDNILWLHFMVACFFLCVDACMCACVCLIFVASLAKRNYSVRTGECFLRSSRIIIYNMGIWVPCEFQRRFLHPGWRRVEKGQNVKLSFGN